MSEVKDSCVEPAAGPILDEGPSMENITEKDRKGGTMKTTAKVGQPAPDFECAAYIDGGFRNMRLSDFRGQWVVLCFYPGDFTFV